MRCGGCRLRWAEIEVWIRQYENIHRLAVRLIYAQIACALIGSLGALYNGVLLVNLVISLFALVAIDSCSQKLARTYAVLLCSSIVLDLSWFFLFSRHIWQIPSEIYGTFISFSVKLTLAMQIIGFSVRLSSSLLWMQMYRLGASNMDSGVTRGSDIDLANNFLNPAIHFVRHPSRSDEVIGGSIDDPSSYSSLLESNRDVDPLIDGGQNHGNSAGTSVSTAESTHLDPSTGRLVHFKEDETDLNHSFSLAD